MEVTVPGDVLVEVQLQTIERSEKTITKDRRQTRLTHQAAQELGHCPRGPEGARPITPTAAHLYIQERCLHPWVLQQLHEQLPWTIMADLTCPPQKPELDMDIRQQGALHSCSQSTKQLGRLRSRSPGVTHLFRGHPSISTRTCVCIGGQ